MSLDLFPMVDNERFEGKEIRKRLNNLEAIPGFSRFFWFLSSGPYPLYVGLPQMVEMLMLQLVRVKGTKQQRL